MITVLHVLGIDPGKTTGWCRITIPYKSIYGDDPSQILEWDTGEFHKSENEQVDAICSLARTTQSLAYLTGPALVVSCQSYDITSTPPALVVEDWDQDPSFKSTDTEALSPVRLGAALSYAVHLGKAGDSHIVFQGRSLAKSTATDERLKAWGMYTVGSDHERDATRHAITALRRAKANPAFRDDLWARQNPPLWEH